jgi:hypothetical protein
MNTIAVIGVGVLVLWALAPEPAPPPPEPTTSIALEINPGSIGVGYQRNGIAGTFEGGLQIGF